MPEGGEAPPIRAPSAGGLFLYACLRQGIFSRGAYDGGGEIRAKKRARARDSCFLTLVSCFLTLVSCFLTLVSCFRTLVSWLRTPGSGLATPESGVRSREPGVASPES